MEKKWWWVIAIIIIVGVILIVSNLNKIPQLGVTSCNPNGDFNIDGVTDGLDVLNGLQFTIRDYEGPYSIQNGDFDCDGEITGYDATINFGIISGIETGGSVTGRAVSETTGTRLPRGPTPWVCNGEFVRGDTTGNLIMDDNDIYEMLAELFYDGINPVDTCWDSFDVNDDEFTDIADPIYVFQWYFGSGTPPPVYPFPDPGYDEYAYGSGPPPISSDVWCDGKDNDGDNIIDEGEICPPK